MSPKCRSKIFFIILVLFVYDIRILFADDVIETQNNDIIPSAEISQNIPNNEVSLKDGQNVFSDKQLQVAGLNNKIVTFQISRALNINFNDIKLEDVVELLHSDDEYQALYNRFVQQNIRLNGQQQNRDIQDEEDDYITEVNLKLSSLYYYNDNDWGCKINNRFIKKNNQNEAHNNVSIVKVNKDNILFVLNRTKADDIEKIKKLKKTKYKYSSDYYIVKNGTMQSLMFRLYIGQSINLKSFKIK